MLEIHIKFKSILSHFTNYLWFVKDNSVNLGNYFTYSNESKLIRVTTAVPGYSKSTGDFEVTIFTNQELQLAAQIYDQVLSLESNKVYNNLPKLAVDESLKVYDGEYHYIDQSKTNRIERCISFLSMARSQTFLPLKISLYIGILESLFTTDASEVVHKVSERVSFYLGGEYETRISVYKSCKSAYTIRSKFFHGQSLPGNFGSLENLKILSKTTDDILRKVITNVILKDSEIFLSSTENLNLYFERLIFK